MSSSAALELAVCLALAACAGLELDRLAMARLAHEEALRDADRRSVQTHAREARDAEAGGMEDAVAVDHQHVRRGIQSGEAPLDRGELAVREVPRDVGEVHPHVEREGLEHAPAVRRRHDARHDRTVPVVREVEARDPVRGRDGVFELHPPCEPELLGPEACERARSLEAGEPHAVEVRDPPPRDRESLPPKPRERSLKGGLPRGPHDAVPILGGPVPQDTEHGRRRLRIP